MNAEKQANFIAQHALIQQSIDNASSLVIQVFGFSVAAIITLIVASFQLKAISILYFVLLIIYFSNLYMFVQAKSIADTEAYIAVFIESELPIDFKWKELIFEKSKISRNPQKTDTFRSPFTFCDYAAFAYLSILFSLIFLLLLTNTFSINLASIVFIIFAIGLIFLTIKYTEYNKEDYYLKCKEYFEDKKGRLLNLKPSEAKLIDSNGKEVAIPESTYQVLHQITEIMASGQIVSLIPQKSELSIQEAANILNVSPIYLSKLLEERKIPFTQVGSELSISFEELMTYKQQRDFHRHEGLGNLTQFLQEEGFYEDEGVKFGS